MYQFLNQVMFLHWPYSPGVIRPFVPARLDLDTFEGTAWVGLVPFLHEDLRFLELPSVPWLSRFPQTNLRTYVCGPGGKQGVWFISLETARLLAVAGGRLLYSQPHRWAKQSVERSGRTVKYRGSRRWPFRAAAYDLCVVIGDPYPEEDLTPLDHFLADRWVLYASHRRILASCSIDHAPWPLLRAEGAIVRQTLTRAMGLPDPAGNQLFISHPGFTHGLAHSGESGPVSPAGVESRTQVF